MTRRMGLGGALAVLGALSVAIYLYLALAVPGTLRFDPDAIQDDARQFQAWMPMLRDPRLLVGDPMAGYWHAMSPPVYRWVFEAGAAIGVDPLLLARFLPALLLAIALWGAWRLALSLAGDRRVAFFAAAFCFAYLVHEDSIFSATPRAFSAPLLLLALTAMQARRGVLAVGLLALLAAIYPTTAMAGLAIFALAHVRRGKRLPLILPWRAVPLIVTGAVAVVLAAVPLQRESTAWGPVITLDQALELPNMNRPDARSSIVNDSGQVAWVCSSRVGFLPEAVPCGWGIPGALPINALLLVPLIVLAIRSARGRPDAEWAGRNRLYLHALVASTVCFVVAALVAFNLHFPGRYTQRVLGPLEWMAIGQLLGGWVVDRSTLWRGAVIALLVALAATPLPNMVRPASPGLLRAIRHLPVNARLAGVSEELNAVPALTGRAITASTEHAIPWHMGYYAPLERNLKLALLAVSTPDPGIAAAAIKGTGAGYLLVDQGLLAHSIIPERYGKIVPAEVAAAQNAFNSGPSFMQRNAQACAIYRAPTAWLLDAGCLHRTAS